VVYSLVSATIAERFAGFLDDFAQSSELRGCHIRHPQVALLLAAVFGVLLVALPGTARIIQLRMLDRRRGTTPAVGPPGADPGDPENR
jgi:hypothetical protein